MIALTQQLLSKRMVICTVDISSKSFLLLLEGPVGAVLDFLVGQP